MTRDARERLLDIRDALDFIETHVGGSLVDPDLSSAIRLHAVLFNLIVIGEASKNVAEEMQQQAPEVPWKNVAGLRDLIAHQYFRVHTDIIEETIRKDLAPLRVAIDKLLG